MRFNPFSLIKADWPCPMSMEAQKRRLSALWHEAYEYFQTGLPEHVCAMYVHDTQSLGFAEAAEAFRLYRMAPPPVNQVKKAPKPADILGIAAPRQAAADQANAMASKIWHAIGALGYSKSQRAVQDYLGPQCMEVIRQMGGNWQQLCATAQTRDQTTWHAQLRDKALCVLASWSARQGQHSLAKARAHDSLHAASSTRLQQVGDIVQRLPALAGGQHEP